MKILLIAFNVPYDSVAHAGGCICDHYLMKMIADATNEVTVISLGEEFEKEKVENQKKFDNLRYETLFKNRSFSFADRIKNIIVKTVGIAPYAGFLTNKEVAFFLSSCKKLKNQGWVPDTVICDWTECVFLIKKIKNVFPDAKYIAVEQDVTFLRYQRIYKRTHNPLIKMLRYRIYKNVLRREIASLKVCDTIKALNGKDAKLLLEYGIDEKRISVISPFYKKYNFFEPKSDSKNILFWGAMNRQENTEAAIWFIQNVLSVLPQEYKFYVIGNHPTKEILGLSGSRVVVTGFVDSLEAYLQDALCFVVPLLQGAGINIKILEGFMTGIPVLTNAIGIEGIPAENQKEYLHCELPEDYISAIERLTEDNELCMTLGKNARTFMEATFDYEKGSYL